MRLGAFTNGRTDFDELFARMLGSDAPAAWNRTVGYDVPTDVFHTDRGLVIRMDLPEVDPGEVDVTVQENVLLINGSRRFPYDADKVRFVRRGTFYGDFTQRVALGKGLDVDEISARYDGGVLELTIPYAQEVQPRKISIEVGSSDRALEA
ncbi:MAG TPA: Hsp20/alpha crystallin family protein [Actinomycetota bacterium]|nr:Hsp20/alpha crystallin family protein [Actinomycetota bacterium]